MEVLFTRRKIQRRGIAMIELIFAIVVMGITLMSVPSLINVAVRSSTTGYQQEAIALGSSQMSLLMSLEWDEADAQTTEDGKGAPILQVSHGTASLDLPRRGAHLRQSVDTDGNTHDASTTLGSEGGDFDDVDDAANTTFTLKNFETNDPQTGDYIDLNITFATDVIYLDDSTSGSNDYNNSSSIQFNFAQSLPLTAATPSTNIKAITMTISTTNTAEELNKTIVLYSFTCNIGSYDQDDKPYAAKDL